MKIPDRLRQARKQALAAGWTVTETRNHHLRWRSPAGRTVITPSTPSDYRSNLNSLSLLRRAGLGA